MSKTVNDYVRICSVNSSLEILDKICKLSEARQPDVLLHFYHFPNFLAVQQYQYRRR